MVQRSMKRLDCKEVLIIRRRQNKNTEPDSYQNYPAMETWWSVACMLRSPDKIQLEGIIVTPMFI